MKKGCCPIVCHYRKRESRVLTVNLEVNLKKKKFQKTLIKSIVKILPGSNGIHARIIKGL